MIIAEPQSPEDFEKYYQVRWEVLRKPWNKPMGSEKDEQENISIHAMALDTNLNVKGVCRLQFNSAEEAQLRFMGVKEEMRGKGIGKMLLEYLEKKAVAQSCKKIILQSRENALEFYKSNGYEIKEKSFLMWGEIQHYLMEKKLS